MGFVPGQKNVIAPREKLPPRVAAVKGRSERLAHLKRDKRRNKRQRLDAGTGAGSQNEEAGEAKDESDIDSQADASDSASYRASLSLLPRSHRTLRSSCRMMSKKALMSSSATPKGLE